MVQEQVPDLVLCSTYRLFLTKAFHFLKHLIFMLFLSAYLVITKLQSESVNWPHILTYFK